MVQHQHTMRQNQRWWRRKMLMCLRLSLIQPQKTEPYMNDSKHLLAIAQMMFRSPLNEWYRITQKFGARPSFYRRISRWRLNAHEWVDFAWPRPGMKVPCFAVCDGTIQLIRSNWAYWLRVFLLSDTQSDGYQYQFMYSHLDSVWVNEGQRVEKGAFIGVIWNSTSYHKWMAVHLHFGMKKTKDGRVMNTDNGYTWWINFLPYLQKERKKAVKKIIDPLKKIFDKEVKDPVFSNHDGETRKLIEIALARFRKKL